MALMSAKNSVEHRSREGRPDIHDWPVEAEGGTRIGTVRDILMDESGQNVRYLDVDLADRDDRVLVPVGHARVDREDRRVRLPGLGPDAVRDVPAWTGNPAEVDERYERTVADAWDQRYGEEYHRRPDFYAHKPGGIEDWESRSGTLGRLDELDDYEVADHSTDPQGWTVVDREGEKIGTVDHLLGDTGMMKVLYLVVDVDDAPGTGDHHILVPVGHATLDRDADEVVLRGMDATGLQNMPPYDGDTLEREQEAEVSRAWHDALGSEHRYKHPRYREEALWGDTPSRRDTSSRKRDTVPAE